MYKSLPHTVQIILHTYELHHNNFCFKFVLIYGIVFSVQVLNRINEKSINHR